MERVENDQDWSLFDPASEPELPELFGEQFTNFYLHLESSNRQFSRISARALWSRILHAQLEAGMPFVLYQDAINSQVSALLRTVAYTD